MSSEEQAKIFASELKQAYDRHMQSLGLPVPSTDAETNVDSLNIQQSEPAQLVSRRPPEGINPKPPQAILLGQPDSPRTDEDKEGGTALLGFLSSLRKSYEDVLREKHTSRGSSETSYYPNSNRPATVTDSNSSQQRDSSVEDSDWNSDKKTDPSSSEDSDKEINDRSPKNHRSKGPLRKRMKMKRVADEIRKGPTS